MPHDIVASLRASAEWIKDLEHESWFETADLEIEAADEIERLRRLLHEQNEYSLRLQNELERCRDR
jgi:molecular chaperone GrpE (heat shock protein)